MYLVAVSREPVFETEDGDRVHGQLMGCAENSNGDFL
jgi:hypothetical protein